jgi:hypothetical protein
VILPLLSFVTFSASSGASLLLTEAKRADPFSAFCFCELCWRDEAIRSVQHACHAHHVGDTQQRGDGGRREGRHLVRSFVGRCSRTCRASPIHVRGVAEAVTHWRTDSCSKSLAAAWPSEPPPGSSGSPPSSAAPWLAVPRSGDSGGHVAKPSLSAAALARLHRTPATELHTAGPGSQTSDGPRVSACLTVPRSIAREPGGTAYANGRSDRECVPPRARGCRRTRLGRADCVRDMQSMAILT